MLLNRPGDGSSICPIRLFRLQRRLAVNQYYFRMRRYSGKIRYLIRYT